MLRQILGATLALGLSTAASVAVPIFDGTVTYIAGSTCGPVGASYSAIYRPQIKTTDPKTGLAISLYRAGVGFTLPVNGQFKDTGAFGMIFVTDQATLVQRSGTFTVVGPTATATTQIINITSATFKPTVGCTFKFKASFLRRPGT